MNSLPDSKPPPGLMSEVDCKRLEINLQDALQYRVSLSKSWE